MRRLTGSLAVGASAAVQPLEIVEGSLGIGGKSRRCR
jgi:hypothetical protein